MHKLSYFHLKVPVYMYISMVVLYLCFALLEKKHVTHNMVVAWHVSDVEACERFEYTGINNLRTSKVGWA